MKRGASIAAMLVLVACSQAPDPQAQAGDAVAAARATYQASLEAGHAWRKTRVTLEAAEAALAAGDLELAGSEAERAMQLAEASLDQARAEADAWKHRMPGS